MGALFGAPTTDSFGNQLSMKRVSYLRPGDRIAMTPGWRSLNWEGSVSGFATVRSVGRGAPGEGGIFEDGGGIKVVFETGGEEPLLMRRTDYVKIMARGS